ncbi:hypothetical protein [Microbacterium sp. PMB16]|uniref:hypothetical protein n=1 Tax=Microbacterium sp. PMB16 TaxID=3120157 RepID=UPI003F4B45F8
MEIGVAYFGNRLLAHVETDLDEIAHAGFRHVLHTFSEVDQRFYRDQMARIVAATHDRGLRAAAAPFGVAGIFGGEEASFFLTEHPNERQRDSDGFVHPAACLNSPLTRALMANWIADAADVGFDEILWDEPGWAFDTTDHRRCTCPSCTDRRDVSPERMLVEFVSDLAATAHDRGLQSTVCLLPDELAQTPGQPWREIAAIPTLTAISSDPYWKTAFLPAFPFVGDVLSRMRGAIGEESTKLECWLQGFGLDLADETDFRAAMEAARNVGAERTWFWAFGAASHMSELGETSPPGVWEYMKRIAGEFAFRDLS